MQIKFRRSGYTLVEALVILIIIAILAAILLPVFSRTHCGSSSRLNCRSNLKQVGLAMLQYAQDNAERMPLIASNAVAVSVPPYARPYGWADAIQPYAKNLDVFQCPSEANTKPVEDATQSGFIDHWFNTNLNTRPLKNIAQPEATFMMGEGNDGRDGSDARYNRNSLPQRWIDDENSPSRRHLDTSNYLYVDGHVKALSPDKTSLQSGFAIVKP